MTTSALVSSKLLRDPERKVSKSGKPFVTAVLREGDGDNVTWWNVLTFSETAADEMMTLKAGDALAASGSFKVEIYNKGGEQRLSYTVFADRIITAKKQKRERPAQKGAEPQSQSQAARQSLEPPAGQFDDEIPF